MTNVVNNLRSRMKTTLLSSGERTESGGEPSSHEPVQVEAKTYFANERTFIQWISAALLLLTVSSIMMGSGNYNGTSSVIAFCSLILVGYASYVYFRRVRLLRSGTPYGYLDFIGPSILAAGVGLGVLIVFADAVKGSEFLPFGKKGEEDRRFLMAPSASSMVPEMQVWPIEHESIFQLQEVDGKCSRYAIDGINLLEYQPRDIILKQDSTTRGEFELIVATPQALVSHPLSASTRSAFLLEILDTEIQSITMVGDRLFALSIGPAKTELVEVNVKDVDASDPYAEAESRFLIQDSTSATGSMVFVPSSGENHRDTSRIPEEGLLYIYLDGTMHIYLLPSNEKDESPTSSSLSRVGSINMKVLNHGLVENKEPITAMEHFEGVTYVLRETLNLIEAWDLNSATLLAEMPLPTVSKNDKWVGMTFQRRKDDDEEKSSRPLLRKSKMAAAATNEKETNTSVYLHMPLDAFPPQLWSFRLEEHDDGKEEELDIFSFPECDRVAMK